MALRHSTTICFAALAMLMGTTAQAATFVEGPVKVDNGNGYVAVDSGTPVQPGDSVMAKPGGRGHIVYDDGCRVAVEEGYIVIVEQQSPCVGAANAHGGVPAGVKDYALFVLPAGAIVGLVFLFKDDDDKPSSP